MKVEIATADVPNVNGHVYPHFLLEHVCKEYDGKECPGMFGIPRITNPNMEMFDIDRISHSITNLRMEGDKLVGDVKVLNTPHGNILNELINCDATPKFRMAGWGYVSKEGTITGFELLTISAVNE